jgi:DNA-binding IclR family transcriptional regulator
MALKMIKFILNAPLEYLRRVDVVNANIKLHVLEYICRADKDCSISDIVNNLDGDKSEICKWLEAFVDLGYIVRDEKTDLYYPTLKTVALGNCIVNNIKARKFTADEMKKRYTNVEELSYISIP